MWGWSSLSSHVSIGDFTGVLKHLFSENFDRAWLELKGRQVNAALAGIGGHGPPPHVNGTE